MFLFVPLLESFTSLTVLLSPHKLLFAVDEVLITSDPDMSNIKPVLLEQGCTKLARQRVWFDPPDEETCNENRCFCCSSFGEVNAL